MRFHPGLLEPLGVVQRMDGRLDAGYEHFLSPPFHAHGFAVGCERSGSTESNWSPSTVFNVPHREGQSVQLARITDVIRPVLPDNPSLVLPAERSLRIESCHRWEHRVMCFQNDSGKDAFSDYWFVNI
jgi:hypothetical protein